MELAQRVYIVLILLFRVMLIIVLCIFYHHCTQSAKLKLDFLCINAQFPLQLKWGI